MPREATSPNRLPNFSEKPRLYIIAAEGQKTEPNYFDALRRHYMFHHRESRVRIHILKRPPEDTGKSAPEYVEKMLEDFFQENSDYEFQPDYDEFWLVADTDKWQSQNAKLSALAKICKEKKYQLSVSNPCFELWLILHLTAYENVKDDIETSNTQSRTCKQIHIKLRQEHRLSGDYLEYLPFIHQAIERAKKLDTAPETDYPENICTRVYLLIQKLIYLPKKNTVFNPDVCHNEKEVESKFIASYLLPALGYESNDWHQEVSFNRLRLDFIAANLVIETKHPAKSLIDGHVEQLKNYMYNFSLSYGLLTNAQELRIYQTKQGIFELVFRCFVKGIESKLSQIMQLIGKAVLNGQLPESIKKPETSDSCLKQRRNGMKVIAIYHNKGGVGKTTVAVNLAAAFRNMGKGVLLIDIDAQANSTFATGLVKFLFDEEDNLRENNILSLLEDGDRGFIPDIRRSSHLFNEPEIDVIPSHITLINKQSELTAFANTRWRLHLKIQKVKDEYDIVIIDAPPSRDIYAEMALIAADYLIIPSDLKPFANQGLPNVRNFIRQADETRISIGKDALNIIGVLPSKISPNAPYLKNTFERQKETVVKNYGFSVMNSKITERKPLSDAFNNPIKDGELHIPDPKSIFLFDKNSASTREFYELADEILQKMES